MSQRRKRKDAQIIAQEPKAQPVIYDVGAANDSDTNPFPPTWPSTWIKGELLNVQGFQDGSYRVTRVGESYQPGKGLEFDSSFDANRFLGFWYARESGDPRAR